MIIYNCIFTPAYFNAALSESRNFFDITDHYLLNNLYADFPTDYIHATADPTENNHILNIYERILQEFNDRQIGYRDIIRGYILELLVILCRLKLQVGSNRTQKLLDVLEYINSHYHEALQVEKLAADAGFSPAHFRRIFKELTGKTPTLYLRTVRIEEACKRLKNDHTANVEQIAEAVGYRDLKHFYSVFKKITGKLPKDYR
ncbi:MAG: helix-turn-helix transcriptional regulator [Clostridia bacterium]|nr:helix-turn-helix transcriptional regulator [Clostridia bacterium]